jgi:sec-independent protein translocase protein TatA
MFGLRMPELLIIGFILVLLFGATKLPALGAGLGQGIRSFKKAFGGEDEKEKKDLPPDEKPPKA